MTCEGASNWHKGFLLTCTLTSLAFKRGRCIANGVMRVDCARKGEALIVSVAKSEVMHANSEGSSLPAFKIGSLYDTTA
eukprot:1138467-Pelagomonas_calceolata.AAC.2